MNRWARCARILDAVRTFTACAPRGRFESAKPEQLDDLNGPLLLRDAVIEQHRSLTEDLHRALFELLTKWVLGGGRPNSPS